MEATLEIGQSKPNWGKKLWRTYRDGWSPVLLALQAHLSFIEKLRSHMGNSSRKYLWPRRTWMHQITQASQEWEKKVQRTFKRDKDPHRAQKQLGECGEFGPWYYRLLTEPPHLSFLEEKRRKVMKQLQGRRILHVSEELCDYRRFMVTCFKRDRLTIFLRQLLGEEKPQFSCDTVRCPLTQMYINHPEELALTLSLHMADWFKKPTHHSGPITEANGDWERLCTIQGAFHQATDHLGIPQRYIDLIWEAIVKVPNHEQVVEALAVQLQQPPSEEEFYQAIKDIKKSTTPGMSGVTCGHIREWPPELQEHCYLLLRAMWGQEHVPQEWKEKWVVLLAKSSDTADINNLRPIGLEDCIRKLWFGITYKRIAKVWQQYGALDEAHHGFVSHKGTDSGILDLLNQLEKALEWGVSALLCSWDVKRAFDSISRTAIRMALHRLGVPIHVIRMIHEMEIEGVTIVRTPLTQYVYDTEGMEGLRKLNERFPGIIIHPERGVPQGDTGSPLIWLAVYDIPLRALTIQRQRLHDRLAHKVNFADDLKSIAGCLHSLQEQANLVSPLL
jgi:hypothetical protein